MSLKTDVFADYQAFLMREKKPTRLRVACLFLRSAGFKAVVLYRIGHWLRQRGSRVFAGLFDRLLWRRGLDINTAADIGEGLRIPHPFAIVIGSDVRIGPRAWILQGVTMGGEGGKVREDGQTQPRLGDDVLVGAGAKLLGPIRIGNRVKIGANAVVNTDLPDDCVAVGIPARVVKIDDRRVEAHDRPGELVDRLHELADKQSQSEQRTDTVQSTPRPQGQ